MCPDHYPMKCNLSLADKAYLLSPEKYKAFFIFQYKDQDDWLEPTLERYFSERTWRLYNAGKEGGTGTKFCNICRYALASDFGIVSLIPLNNNVFQEIGLMQGLQKPLLYLLNAKAKLKLPFDIEDQIYIEHSDEVSLRAGLDNKIRLLLEKVRLSSGFETAQKESIRDKISKLNPRAVDLLKHLVLGGNVAGKQHNFNEWVKSFCDLSDPNPLNELIRESFIIDETSSGGSSTILIRKLNEPYRKYLEELLWE
jgi:hypothetical protein